MKETVQNLQIIKERNPTDVDSGDLNHWGTCDAAHGGWRARAAEIPDTIDSVFHRASARVDRVVRCDKGVRSGAPYIADTRIPVYMLIEGIALGHSVARIRKAYPDLTDDQFRKAFEFAAMVLGR